MERLTCNKLKTICDGYFVNFASKEEATKYRMLAESAPKYEEIYKKLTEYENAEEQGLLLRLPCKVGTEVYEIEQQFWIDRKGCKECVYFGNDGLGDYCDYCEDEPAACTKIVLREFTMRMLEEFGKTVFLTREEAEQALAKIKTGEKQ